MDNGLLIAVSGFSGSGKGTLMKKLLADYPEEYALSISATTRQPREGETEGVEYFFKTKEEFEELIKNDMLIEHATYCDNYYGTPREFVEAQRKSGKDVLLEIEVQGALQIKEKFPDTVLIFVTPPTIEELKSRLIGRGTEDMETINKRISRAAEEAVIAYKYDYLLVNDTIEAAAENFRKIADSERQKVSNRTEFLEKLQDELGGK